MSSGNGYLIIGPFILSFGLVATILKGVLAIAGIVAIPIGAILILVGLGRLVIRLSRGPEQHDTSPDADGWRSAPDGTGWINDNDAPRQPVFGRGAPTDIRTGGDNAADRAP
jgi:hypothetical protein